MKKRLFCVLVMLALLLPGFGAAGSAHDTALRQAEICAFRAEYETGDRDYIVKWQDPIRVFMTGHYTKTDVAFFYGFLCELAVNVPGLPPVSLVNSEKEANVVMRFVKLSEMDNCFNNYVKSNWGFFEFFQSNARICKSTIAIAYDKCDQEARSHLMMEEFIGSLGLANDHELDRKSILYQKWTTVQKLTEADWCMLRMLYDESVRPGCPRDEALRIMADIY